MNTNIRFYLDKTYNSGVDMKMIKKRIIEKKPIKQYLNDKPTTIFLGVTFMGSYFKVSTGEKIKSIHWDSEEKKVKSNYIGSYELNILLDNIEGSVRKNIYQARVAKPKIGFSEVKTLVKNVISNNMPSPESNDFFEVLEKFIEERKGLIKPLTTKKYKTFRNLMIDFQQFYPKPFVFDEVNPKFEEAFKGYLINERKLLNNTIDKYFDNLKSFMKWSFDMKYHNSVDFNRFKAGREKTDAIYLTIEELMAIEDLELKHNPRLDRVKDAFLFLCYTGQRYSDLKNLKYEDLSGKGDEMEWNVNQIKSNKSGSIFVPIIEEAELIIEKYKQDDYEKNWKVLPVISDVNMNLYIKEVCKLAGITDEIKIIKYSGINDVVTKLPKYKLISSHCGRRSFVTLGLHFGMPIEAIMAITGHENYKTIKSYIGKNKEHVRESFQTARAKMKRKARKKMKDKKL